MSLPLTFRTGFGAQFGWWAQSGRWTRVQAMRCDTGIPSRVIRLSTEQPTRASVFWAGSVRAKAPTDDCLVAEHGGLPKRAPAVADRLLPAQTALVPDHLDVLVALTGRGARGRARHGG